MESLEVSQVSAASAAAAMRVAGLRAPLDCDTAEDIAAHGECFQFRNEAGTCVFVVRRKRGVLWIDAAASDGGAGMTAAGLHLAREVARQSGCKKIAFETGRRGLVRLAKQHGARVAGVIMEMDAR